MPLLQSSGKITMLWAHDVGTSFGPPADAIDVEAVIQLDTQPGKAFGFQLRTDAQGVTRAAMFDLLSDAFANNRTVTIDYNLDVGKNNGVIIRAAVTR